MGRDVHIIVATNQRKLVGQRQDRPSNGIYPLPYFLQLDSTSSFPVQSCQQSHQMVGQSSHGHTLLNTISAAKLFKQGPGKVKKSMTSGFGNIGLTCCYIQSPYSNWLKDVRLSDYTTKTLSVCKKYIQRAQFYYIIQLCQSWTMHLRL